MVTIKDISKKTGYKDISQNAKKLILETAKEMGYHYSQIMCNIFENDFSGGII